MSTEGSGATVHLRMLDYVLHVAPRMCSKRTHNLIGDFTNIPTVCARASKALARRRICAGSSEPSLLAYAQALLIKNPCGRIKRGQKSYHDLYVMSLDSFNVCTVTVTPRSVLLSILCVIFSCECFCRYMYFPFDKDSESHSVV